MRSRTWAEYKALLPESELLKKATENAAWAMANYAMSESKQEIGARYSSVAEAMKVIAETLIEESFPYAMKTMVRLGAARLRDEVRNEMVAVARAGDYGLALNDMLKTIKEQGAELTGEQVVEVVKSFSEYQKEAAKQSAYKKGYREGYRAKEAELHRVDEYEEEE